MNTSNGRATPGNRGASTERRLERTRSTQAHTAQSSYSTRHKRSGSVTSNGSSTSGPAARKHHGQRPLAVADNLTSTYSSVQRTAGAKTSADTPLASRPIAVARSRRNPNHTGPSAAPLTLADSGSLGQKDNSSGRVAHGYARPTQRSLRRYNSTGVSRSQSPPPQQPQQPQQQHQQQYNQNQLQPQFYIQTTVAAPENNSINAVATRRAVQSINGTGSQRSTNSTAASASKRLHKSPSAGDMQANPVRLSTKHASAAPALRTATAAANSANYMGNKHSQLPSRGPSRSSVYSAGSAGAAGGRARTPSGNRMQGSRPSSPSNSLRTSRIPRLPSASDGAAPPRRLLHEQYYELMQRLRVEQETNNELMEELRSVASYTELLGSELEQARVDASEAKSRTELAESALEEQKAVNVALESKIAALSAIICTQADTRGTAMDGSLPSPLRSQGKNIDGLVLDATVVAATAARDTGADDGLASSEQPPPSDDWRADRARILAEIGAIHATCTLDKPESEMDEATKCDLRLVEQYLDRATTNDGNVGDAAFPAFQSPTGTRRGFNGNGNGSGSGSGSGTTNKMVPPPSPHLVTPVQRKIAEQEERAKRRRSTMMFAGLIRPSNGTAAPTSTSSLLGSRDLLANTPRRPSVADDGGSQTLPCGRCQQLLETMQALEIDNDYYREANGKLRDSIADVVSKHNALVRLFERERMRRRENRANALAEASRVAARDRAVLEAQQRAELEATMDSSSRAGGSPHKESLGTLDGELAQEFARALSIVSPTAARYKPPRSRLPAKTLSEDSAHMAPPSITSPLHS